MQDMHRLSLAKESYILSLFINCFGPLGQIRKSFPVESVITAWNQHQNSFADLQSIILFHLRLTEKNVVVQVSKRAGFAGDSEEFVLPGFIYDSRMIGS